MWRRELGDWEERRHRRPPGGDALPVGSGVTGSSRFMYKLPAEAPDHAPMDAPKPYVPVETRAAEDNHITAQWVVVSGVDHGDIGNVREYLDVRVGRTIAHYTEKAVNNYRHMQPGHDSVLDRWDGAFAEGAVAIRTPYTGTVYVQFEDAAAAARAVRIAHFAVEAEWGVAAAAGERHRQNIRGLQPRWSLQDARGYPGDGAGSAAQDNFVGQYGTNSIEFSVTTCTDRTFLAARAAAMQMHLWGHPTDESTMDTVGVSRMGVGAASPSPGLRSGAASAAVAARVVRPHASVDAASPGRRSATLEPPPERSHTPPPAACPLPRSDTPHDEDARGMRDGDVESEAADGHPMLTRHRTIGAARAAIPSTSGSSYTIDVDAPSSSTSTARHSHQQTQLHGGARVPNETDRLPRMREGAVRASGHGGDASLVHEEGLFTGQTLLHTRLSSPSAALPQTGNRSVLSLFFTSWLTSYGNVWVSLVRAAVVVAWTLLRVVAALLPSQSLTARWRAWRSADAAAVEAMESLSAPQAHYHGARPSSTTGRRRTRRQRERQLCAHTLVGDSPLALLANLFQRYCVFAPTPEEVDMTLWSWLSMRSPFPQQSLRHLKQYLSLHRPYYSPGQSDAFRGTPFTHYDSFRAVPRMPTVAEATEDEYYRSRGRAPPPPPLPGVEEPAVLFTWRPARALTRYSLLSLVLTVIVLFMLYDQWASTLA